MLRFSQLLSNHIKRKKVNITQMAIYLDIQRTNLYKIKTGERLPKNIEIVKKMAQYLHLDLNDTKELLDAYEIENIGEFIYYRRNDVKEFLKKTDFVNPELLDVTINPITLVDESLIINNIQTISGINNLFQVMKKIVIDECSNTDLPTIDLMCQPIDMRVISVLKTACAVNKETVINHIFCVDNSEDVINYQTYNIKCLTNIFSLLSVTNRYFPFYYYNEISSQSAHFSLFSNVLITKRYTLVFTNDFEYGVIYTDETSRKIYTRMFEIYKQKTNKLLHFLNYEKYCLLTINNDIKANKENLLFTTPCPTYTIKPEDCISERHLSNNFPNREKFISFYNEFVVMYNNRIKNNQPNLNLYFTLQGLKYFTRTGYFQDIPPTLSIPLDLDERILILTRWKKFLAGYENVYMLDFPEYPESSTLTLIFNPEKVSFITITPSGNPIYVQIDEASIVTAFYDYFQSIITTRCCSLEKTLAAIDECIDILINQKDCI